MNQQQQQQQQLLMLLLLVVSDDTFVGKTPLSLSLSPGTTTQLQKL
jgi:hypothetical protein